MTKQPKLGEEHTIARIFITGSTDGLSLAATPTLMEEGHQIVLYARSQQRTSAFTDLGSRSLGVVVGDLSSAAG
jgi:short-subunit dehydrogenase